MLRSAAAELSFDLEKEWRIWISNLKKYILFIFLFKKANNFTKKFVKTAKKRENEKRQRKA